MQPHARITWPTYADRIDASRARLHLQWDTKNPLLAPAFRSWCGDLSQTRVLFTPDVLIAIDTDEHKGYLYDDGWTIEVYIEVGGVDFEDHLKDPAHTRQDLTAETESTCAGLLSAGLARGQPFDRVHHLI